MYFLISNYDKSYGKYGKRIRSTTAIVLLILFPSMGSFKLRMKNVVLEAEIRILDGTTTIPFSSILYQMPLSIYST